MSDTPQSLLGGSDTPGTATTTPQHAHHHPHLHGHSGKRLRHFFSPEGRRIQVAHSPDEANNIRKQSIAVNEKDDFDLVIHGSPEHVSPNIVVHMQYCWAIRSSEYDVGVACTPSGSYHITQYVFETCVYLQASPSADRFQIEALRHTHAHHESHHRALQEQHGDLAHEFERVIRDLDALTSELHMISEHAVQLDANFSKYGYSAHLRTHDGTGSSSDSDSASSFDKSTWRAERKLGTHMLLYQKPIVRQYFHKGLLWRAKEAQEVASYELFIDLFYVGIIAITGDTAAEHPTGESLLRFVITFAMGWKFWSDISLLISWFDSDDVLRRCSVLFILTCLLGFTTNMASAFEHTYTPLVAFYLTARLFLMTSIFWYAWTMPMG
jgi:hypothetical protein